MTKLPLKIALFLSGQSGLVSAILMFFMKSEESATSLLGLSKSKLALIMLTGIISLLFLWLSFKWGKEQDKTYRLLENGFLKYKTVWIFVLFWTFVLMFILQQEALFVYLMRPIKMIDTGIFFLRIAPLLVWLSLVCIYLSVGIFMANLAAFEESGEQTQLGFVSLLLLVVRALDPRRKTNCRNYLISLFKQYRLGLIIWLAILLIWVFVWQSGIGLVPDDRFWNIAGVPLLPLQIIGVVLLVLLLLDLRSLLPEKLSLQVSASGSIVLVAVGIWALAVVIWQSEPLFHTYFSPGPYPPNGVHYPFSDAMRFDSGSQYLIMGRGISNNGFTERPFLYVFFGLLHLLAGQDYDQVMFAQILFLSLIPVFLFLIGRQLHSPIAGIAMGVLGIMHGKNAIASAKTAGIINPKVMMSELPAALLLIILSYCVIRWLQENRTIWAVFAGGLTGLAIGIRGNVLVVVPMLIAIIVLHHIIKKLKAKDLLIKSSLFALALFLVVTPYSIKTHNAFGNVFFLPKIRTVIERAGNQRLEPLQVKLQKIIPDHRHNDTENLAMPTASIGALQLPEELIDYTVRHFIHNQIMAVLVFPLDYTTLQLNKITDKPFWGGDDPWEGALSPVESVLLAGNLLVISLGVGFAIKTWQITGAVPLLIHLSYQLGNGLARTSGGRYLAPTNWVLVLYFCLGAVGLAYSLRRFSGRIVPSAPHGSGSNRIGLIVFSLVLFLGLGASFMYFDLIVPKYPLVDNLEAAQMLEEIDWTQYEIPPEMRAKIENFLSTEDTEVQMGLALYPQYYKPGEQSPSSSYLPRMETDTSRIYFMLLAEGGPISVSLIWGDQGLKTFPHAEYGLLAGRMKDDYVEGYLFVPISTTDREVYYSEASLWE